MEGRTGSVGDTATLAVGTELNSSCCDARTFARIVRACTTWLGQHADYVNSLNVYPVPDGDTGTNMYLTMQAAVRELETLEGESLSSVTHAVSQGALMGARGNSGVILSQLLRGLEHGLAGAEHVTATSLADAFTEAADTAYRGVLKPVEGTILTVARDSALSATAAAARATDIGQVLKAAVSEARNSVERTPSLLPVLADAGVVDAGGEGLSVLLQGALQAISSERIEVRSTTRAPVRVEHLTSERYGFDIQLTVTGQELDSQTITQAVATMGDSVLVVGDRSRVRLHIHSDRPGSVIEYCAHLGRLDGISIENMDQQSARFAQALDAPAAQVEPSAEIGVVAVVAGDGLRRVFQSFGASQVVSGGATMNPSCAELLAAVTDVPAEQVIVLPNNQHITLAAEQAARVSDKQVAVVPTQTMPQGIAALLALNYQANLDANHAFMQRAASEVRTVEVTAAVRSALVDRKQVLKGQIISLLDGTLVTAGESVPEALRLALESVPSEDFEVITMYYGDGVNPLEAEQIAHELRLRYPTQQVEIVDGGQPNYSYILSIE